MGEGVGVGVWGGYLEGGRVWVGVGAGFNNIIIRIEFYNGEMISYIEQLRIFEMFKKVHQL
jgi:hypothetical protein